MKDFLRGTIYVGIFAIPFIPLIVTDTMFFPFITGKNFTFRIIVEIIFAAWVVLALLDKMYRPRFSWILVSLSTFVGIIFLADLLGEYPLKSLWSNFERMDGFVTLAHFFLFILVLSSTFRNNAKLWMYYLYTSIGVALYVSLSGLAAVASGTARARLDSTLGNAAYMAIYMLFHIFFVILLFIRSRDLYLRIALGIVGALFVYVLLLTGTRGTFLGLLAGSMVAIAYLAVFSRKYPQTRKFAIGGFIVVVLFGGLLFSFRDSSVVQSNLSLRRIANISIEKDLQLRFDIWNMALKGVKERPILGWGQGNFNYIFNAKYDPNIYSAESWYDRAHDIMFDWLVAGGVLGLLSYLSIFVALFYYLVWRPIFRSEDDDEQFTVLERAVLIGLIIGYFVHNLVVFDNIVSYIFFAILLAFIHARVGEKIPKLHSFEIDPRIVTNIVAPVVLVVMGSVVYFVNIPAIRASADIIVALQANNIPGRLSGMEDAVNRNSFGYQEVVEQLAQQAMRIEASPNISPDQKKEFIDYAEKELLNLEKIKPNDARVEVFISGFYRSIGNLEKAKEHIEIARKLSPDKQAIILEQGIIAFQMGDFEAMHGYFKEAYELQHDFTQARIFYAASFMYIGQPEKVEEFITDEYIDAFARNNFALQSASRFQQTDLLEKMFEVKIKDNPQDAQTRASLSFLFYQKGDTKKTIEILQQAVTDIPSFAKTGNCYIANIEANKKPSEGCQ